MATIKPLVPETSSPEERRIGDIIFTDRGEEYGGPSAIMIKVPEYAERFDQLRQFLVRGSTLPRPLQQIAILVVVRKSMAQYAWQVRVNTSRELGIAEQVIEAIRDGSRPNFDDQDHAAIYDYVTELLDTNRVTEDTHARVQDFLGEAGLIELVGLVGLYAALALQCNAFEPPLMVDGPAPLPE